MTEILDTDWACYRALMCLRTVIISSIAKRMSYELRPAHQHRQLSPTLLCQQVISYSEPPSDSVTRRS
jgi:hypothetical protein